MPKSQAQPGPLYERIGETPVSHDPVRALSDLEDLKQRAQTEPDCTDLVRAMQNPAVTALLSGIFGASPYLTRLIMRRPAALATCLAQPPEQTVETFRDNLDAAITAATSQADVMRALRLYKADMALLLALTDLGSVWPVMTITRHLADVADTATGRALAYLFAEAQRKGDWLDIDPNPASRSGYFVIAMGKHGAFELNYSSDIDLIVFFDPEKASAAPRHDITTFFVRITRDLVKLIQEQTADGYVFRTDLRLRPDPGATAVAISIDAAHSYYESVGQNWERAALIKARIIAGDATAGTQFLNDLSPFIWRKYLDFAAIADIHAMKRQIHATKGFGTIAVSGHDIKVGRGGIREIEFFAQTQQLIAGGRQQDLRAPATLDALNRLVDRNWLKPEIRDELSEAYTFLRRIEHRLQMLDDEQTQTLPTDPAMLDRLAHFSGYATFDDFSTALTTRLQSVQGCYARLFEDSPELASTSGSMVFAGATNDPETLLALKKLGFEKPERVIEGVRGWHHGRVRAVRTARTRERLTEVQPALIEALSRTVDPDAAFSAFDRFLSELPSGVQLFSLLRQQPALLDLIAAIMGTAPRLARVLSRQARLLDAVLDPGFFGAIAHAGELAALVRREMATAPSLELALNRARIVGNEQSFLIGVRVITGTIGASNAGSAYATLADELIAALAQRVTADMIEAHGRIPGGDAAVIAMGKLGSVEMTAASDLDLIVVYDFDADATQSDGPRPLAPTQYYNRFTQRLINAFTAPTAEGALYDIDMRLRPSGQKGPVATQLSSFIEYQRNEAWTWEHMALTRARVIASPDSLRTKLETAIADILIQPRDRSKIATDVREMRIRIAETKGTTDPWDLKQVRGGLVDLEFIVQHLQLIHLADHPQIRDQNTRRALHNFREAGILAPEHTDRLMTAARLLHNLTQVLRLSLDGPFNPETAPDGLKKLLAKAGSAPTFEILAADLIETEAAVSALFDELIQ